MLDELNLLLGFNQDDCWIQINKRVRKRKVRRISISILGAAAILTLLFTLPQIFNNNIDKDEIIISRNINRPILITNSGNKFLLAKGLKNKLSIDDANFKYNNKLIHTDTTKSEKISYNTLIVPYGSEFKLTLPDKTIVWLNAGSKIEYPTKFIGKQRRIKLSGEGYLEVSKNKKKPFIVDCEKFSVKVLGTKFNICTYPEDDVSQITLSEGSIAVDIDNESLLLAPNQQLSLENSEVTIKNVCASNYCCWKGADFYFNDEKLETIMKKLSRWYNVEVFYQNKDIKNKYLKGSIPKYESLEDILKLIKKVHHIEFKINKNSVILSDAK